VRVCSFTPIIIFSHLILPFNRCWDIRSGKQTHQFTDKEEQSAYSCCDTPLESGTPPYLACSYYSTVSLWDVRKGKKQKKPIAQFDAHSEEVVQVYVVLYCVLCVVCCVLCVVCCVLCVVCCVLCVVCCVLCCVSFFIFCCHSASFTHHHTKGANSSSTPK
jgi:hypothetical protein